ncbi:MAG: NUDIX hydrolase [Gammaproteobacteria bacterium]
MEDDRFKMVKKYNPVLADCIRKVDLNQVDETHYTRRAVGCLILTKDGKILLQHRPLNWRTFPGCLATFGGGIEVNELPLNALIRELKEELGADAKEQDIISLGAITESATNHLELIYQFFWHDKAGTITGCYECEARYYESIAEAFEHPKIMDDVRWLLEICQAKGLLNPEL